MQFILWQQHKQKKILKIISIEMDLTWAHEAAFSLHLDGLSFTGQARAHFESTDYHTIVTAATLTVIDLPRFTMCVFSISVHACLSGVCWYTCNGTLKRE